MYRIRRGTTGVRITHKEMTKSFIAKFINDVREVKAKAFINPFMCQQFQKINCDFIFPDVIVQDCSKAFTEGKIQYDEFRWTRFVEGSKDVLPTNISKCTLSRNNFKLPKDLATVIIENPRVAISPSVYTKFRDACTNRPELAKKTFQGEFTSVPECFVTPKDNSKPYHNDKSKIHGVLPDLVSIEDRNSLEVDGVLTELVCHHPSRGFNH